MAKLKLDKQDVYQIKMLFKHTNLMDKHIAIMYNVSRKHINQIRNKKSWNYDIEQPIESTELFSRDGTIY